MPRQGQPIGDYNLRGVIYTATESDIWLGEHQHDRRLAAIKIPIERVGRLHLKRDALLLRLNHPNVVRCLSADLDSELPYVIMDYIAGANLQDCAQHISLPNKIHIVSQIASAIAHLEEYGIVHRDIARRNIILSELPAGGEGTAIIHATLIDFGHAAAKPFSNGRPQGYTLTEPGAEGNRLTGLGFIAPELYGQVDPTLVDGRADIFALGALFAELLIGSQLYSLAQFLQSANGLPVELCDIINRCCQESPADRFQNAAALFEALQSASASYTAEQLYRAIVPRRSYPIPTFIGSTGEQCPRCRDDRNTRVGNGGHYCRPCELFFKKFAVDRKQAPASPNFSPPTTSDTFSQFDDFYLAPEYGNYFKGINHGSEILAMSPDSRLLVGVGGEGASFSETLTGQELYFVPTIKCSVIIGSTSISFTPDGLHIAVVSERSVSLWRWDSQASRQSIPPTPVWTHRIPASLRGSSLSKDGRLLCLYTGDTCAICDLSNGMPIGFLPRRQAEQAKLTSIFFLTDTHDLVSISEDGSVAVWRGESSAKPPLRDSSSNWWRTFSWWNPSTWRDHGPLWMEIAKARHPGIEIATLVTAPTGDRFAAIDTSGTLSLWDGRQLGKAPYTVTRNLRGAHELAFSNDNTHLIVATPDYSAAFENGNRFLVFSLRDIAADGAGVEQAYWRSPGGNLPSGVHSALFGPLRKGPIDTGIWIGLKKGGKPCLLHSRSDTSQQQLNGNTL